MININDVPLINIASIHATILSIIIAFNSAYAIYVYTNLDKMESRVFIEAERINREITFSYTDQSNNNETYLAGDSKNREKILDRLLKLASGNYSSSEEAGEEAVKIMNAVSLYYPFRSRAIIKNDTITIDHNGQPISFKNMDMVKKWIDDIWFISTLIMIAWEHYNLRKILDDYSRKYNKEMGVEKMEKFMIDFSEAFIPNIIKARNIAGSTIPYLSEYNLYKKRMPSKWIIISWLFVAGIAFISGVFIPMFSVSKCQILLIWIPISFYVLTFFSIMWKIIRL